MVNIYIWMNGTGHVGLSVNSEYISWEANLTDCHLDFNDIDSYKSHFNGVCNRTLKDDISIVDYPQISYSIHGLNEEAILLWWRNFKMDSNNKWNRRDSSCFTIVIKAINSGLLNDDQQLRYEKPERSYINQYMMKAYIEKLLKNMKI